MLEIHWEKCTILFTYSNKMTNVLWLYINKLDLSSWMKGFISSSNGYLGTSYLSKNWCVKGRKEREKERKKEREKERKKGKPWINSVYLGLVPDSQVRIVCWVPAYGYMEEKCQRIILLNLFQTEVWLSHISNFKLRL